VIVPGGIESTCNRKEAEKLSYQPLGPVHSKRTFSGRSEAVFLAVDRSHRQDYARAAVVFEPNRSPVKGCGCRAQRRCLEAGRASLSTFSRSARMLAIVTSQHTKSGIFQRAIVTAASAMLAMRRSYARDSGVHTWRPCPDGILA
jgi:hypothetical protein